MSKKIVNKFPSYKQKHLIPVKHEYIFFLLFFFMYNIFFLYCLFHCLAKPGRAVSAISCLASFYIPSFSCSQWINIYRSEASAAVNVIVVRFLAS